jgi:triosephosphate isomerase
MKITPSKIVLLTLSLSLSVDAFVAQKSASHGVGYKASSISTTELFERKAFITGNWKLNPQTKAEAVDLARGIVASIPDNAPCDVGLFVPVPFIETVQAIVGNKLIVGAEVSSG